MFLLQTSIQLEGLHSKIITENWREKNMPECEIFLN